MGKALHSQIIRFFRERMSEHGQVSSSEVQDHDTELLYKITRTGRYPAVIVHLSDAYHYGKSDYIGHPGELVANSFVLIAKPEGDFDSDLVEIAATDCIGIGKISKLMGALHREKVWEYRTREELEQAARR